MQTIDVVMLLDNPYPVDRNVTVTNMTAQMVAPSGDSWRPVPLDEVSHCSLSVGIFVIFGTCQPCLNDLGRLQLYVHHYVADGR